MMRGRECKPSRVDLAFDYNCDDDLTPCKLVDRWRDPLNECKTREGFTIGASGQEPMLTRYIGSRDSEVFIRIYRKDHQDPTFWGCPTMRVEVVMKSRRAREWWRVWCDDMDEATRSAAAHVERMAGVRIIEGTLDLPEREEMEAKNEALSLFRLIEQHGSQIAAYEDAGIDVIALARDRAGVVSRETKWRMARRTKSIIAAGADNVLRAARGMLGLCPVAE